MDGTDDEGCCHVEANDAYDLERDSHGGGRVQGEGADGDGGPSDKEVQIRVKEKNEAKVTLSPTTKLTTKPNFL